jgi:hypothetical protein
MDGCLLICKSHGTGMAKSPIGIVSFQDARELFYPLWMEARELWDRFEKSDGFEAYVPADYAVVLQALQRLQGKAVTILEWGSGLGVVTIMASRLGFEAYGLEISPQLVDHARFLADRYSAGATFAQGSFVPNEYEWNPRLGEDGTRTDFDASDGYERLDMRLSDFDVVYAYPWPDEHAVFNDILRGYGRAGGLFLTYDVREGMQRKRVKNRSGRIK